MQYIIILTMRKKRRNRKMMLSPPKFGIDERVIYRDKNGGELPARVTGTQSYGMYTILCFGQYITVDSRRLKRIGGKAA